MDVLWLCPTTRDCNCPWSGRDTEILPHFQANHSDLLLSNSAFSVDITIDKTVNKLLSLNEQVYLVQIQVNNAVLKLKLRFMGTTERANELTYNTEVVAGECSFKYLPKETCNCVIAYDGYVEVDLQTIKLTAGKLEEITCILNIEDLVPEKDPVEETPLVIEEPAPKRKCSVEVSSQPPQELDDIEEEDMFYSEENSEMGSDRQNGNGSVSSHRSSFLRNFFWDDSCSLYESNSELECASCSLDMFPPIFLCEEGHSVCNSCKSEKCHACNKNITNLRNEDLEEISKKYKHACRYANYGCLERFRYDEIKIHELNCRYCIYKCCLCSEEGRFGDMKTHFKLFHPSIKIHEDLINKFPRNVSFVIINRENGVFYCNSEVKGSAIEWNVTFCGPKERWFSCELKIKGRKGDVSYFLRRDQNHYRLLLLLNDLKAANVKDKYAELAISSY